MRGFSPKMYRSNYSLPTHQTGAPSLLCWDPGAAPRPAGSSPTLTSVSASMCYALFIIASAALERPRAREDRRGRIGAGAPPPPPRVSLRRQGTPWPDIDRAQVATSKRKCRYSGFSVISCTHSSLNTSRKKDPDKMKFWWRCWARCPALRHLSST